MTHDEMMKLRLHPGWKDERMGATDAKWCRCVAVLDGAIGLKADISWNDDGDDDQPITKYDSPILILETTLHFGTEKEATLDTIPIELSVPSAIKHLTKDPANLLQMYAKRIAKMRVIPNSPAYGDTPPVEETQIIITVEGGVITSVTSNQPAIKVRILDYDNHPELYSELDMAEMAEACPIELATN